MHNFVRALARGLVTGKVMSVAQAMNSTQTRSHVPIANRTRDPLSETF